MKNSNLEWKLLSTVTGNTVVNLPEAYNELLIKVRGNNDKSYVSVWHLIPAMLSETEQYFPLGASRGGTQTTYGNENRIKVTSSTVSIHKVYANGTEYTSASVMEIYYR